MNATARWTELKAQTRRELRTTERNVTATLIAVAVVAAVVLNGLTSEPRPAYAGHDDAGKSTLAVLTDRAWRSFESDDVSRARPTGFEPWKQ